jgi:hypothetical protein
VFFNNADKRLLLKGNKHYDVFFDAWADALGQSQCLFIEWAITKHRPRNKAYSKNIISDLPLKLCVFALSLFTRTAYLTQSEVDTLNNKLNTKIDFQKVLKTRFSELKIYRLLFKIVKPKAIFLISSFTKETIVLAAKLEGVKVFETQHGYIGHNHQFYNSVYNFRPHYYPDYLLSFGTYEKKNLPENFIFSTEQILPVGSLFLEHIQKTFYSKELEDLKKKYSKVFCVTLQNVEEDKFLSWIETQARQRKDCLFIIKPRRKISDYSDYLKTHNCVLMDKFSVYEILKYSDYNITIYSTTAIEAAAFDVKTIFYNINNLSTKYFMVNEMYASVVEEGCNLKDLNLRLEKRNTNPYFVLDYYNNINNLKKYV